MRPLTNSWMFFGRPNLLKKSVEWEIGKCVFRKKTFISKTTLSFVQKGFLERHTFYTHCTPNLVKLSLQSCELCNRRFYMEKP